MGVRDLLRRVDQRAVPPLAGTLNRLFSGPARIPLIAALTCGAVILSAAGWRAEWAPVGGTSGDDVARVGVPQGSSIPAYVAASRRELRSLAAAAHPGGAMYALVTLSAYLAPDRLAPVVGPLPVAAVYARVPLPQTQTEIVRIDAFRVPEDVLAGMDLVALRKDGEALDYQDLSARLTGDTDTERRLRAVYASGARVAAAEAEGYRRRCSCVYALILRATPGQLLRLTGRGEVRAVDPVPGLRRLDRAVFLPPLPEQTGVSRPPEDQAPTGGEPAVDGSLTGGHPPDGGSRGLLTGGMPAELVGPAGVSSGSIRYRHRALNVGGPVRRTIGRRPDRSSGVV